ncbi:unnamed protein product [marine sediment metagenome]|uniref:Uncharacterized protein n=1 Tax=marine sediment metagenome TaxID=412755 RepID=X0ZU10_9ZZZZ
MGYSSPLGYTGYAPTDDKLQEDTNTYTENGPTWVSKITGYAIADVQPKSKLRFKVEIQNTTFGKLVYFAVFINNTIVWAEDWIQNIWKLYESDVFVTWRRGDFIEVKLKCDILGGQAQMKNFEICGKVSPVRLD